MGFGSFIHSPSSSFIYSTISHKGHNHGHNDHFHILVRVSN